MSTKGIAINPSHWSHPILSSASAATKTRIVDLVFLMQKSVKPGYAVGQNAEPLSIDQLAQSLSCSAEELKADIDLFCGLGILDIQSTDNCLMYPSLVRSTKLSDTRRKAGRAGGNPVLKKVS
jgi:hypothetical protein